MVSTSPLILLSHVYTLSLSILLFFILYFMLISLASALSEIVWNNSSSLFSSFSSCCFSSSRLICTYLRTIYKISFSYFSISNFVAYVLALDRTSCATLTYNLYSDFLGTLANTNSIYSTSLICFFNMSSSIFNMSLVMHCFLLLCLSFVLRLGKFIFSKTGFTYVSSFIIFSLCFSSSSYSSVVWSYTLFATKYVSYFFIVYWGTSL
jgi:hypothetical protein